MNLTVYTGPDPSANLAELLKRTPFRRGSVCAVVPDRRSVTAMQKHLAELSGNAFMGHRVYTMEGLALAILSYNDCPSTIIPDHLKRALVTEIVKSRIGEHSKFAAVAEYPGFVSLLVTFIEETRSRFGGKVSSDPELVSITTAYESHLRRLNLTDHEGVVSLALESDSIERFAAAFNGSLILDGFYDLTERQFKLLRRLFEAFSLSAATLVNDPSRPALFGLPDILLSGYRSVGARLIEVSGSEHSVPGDVLSGFRGGTYPPFGDSEYVQIHTFRNETSEADWIAGTVHSMLQAGTFSPEDIMIVSRFRPGYGSPVERALRREGIPVRDGFSRQFTTHPVVRLAIDALEASLHSEKEDLLSSVQRSCFTGDQSFRKYDFLDGIDDRGWSCMTASVDSPEGYAASFKKMIECLKVKDNLNGGGKRERAVSEMAVYERLFELLDEFTAIYSPFRKMMRLNEFNRLLNDFLGSVSISDRPSPSAGIEVLDVNHARYVKRDIVFVTGLDDSTFPDRYYNYSLHNSDINSELREHHRMEEPLLFYMSACRAKRLYLTFPGIDDEGRDNAMSPYLREIYEGTSSWSSPHFHTYVAGAAWEQGTADGRGQKEQIIRILKRDFTRASSILSYVNAHDNSKGKCIRKAVESFISRVEDTGIDISTHPSFEETQHEWSRERVFAVTDLEMYISCPIRFFLKRIMSLSPELPVTGDIDPATRGHLVHVILARFYSERVKRYGKAVFDVNELSDCKDMMKEIVEDVFERSVHRIGKLHPVMLLAEKRFLQLWMESFLEHEIEYFEQTNFEPSGFEIDFGLTGGNRSSYPFLKVTHEKETVLIGGRIDRIDLETSGEDRYLRIIDYKTGLIKNSNKDLVMGYGLQIPLYLAAAVENIFSGSLIHDGVFYSLKEMEFKTYRNKSRKQIIRDEWNEYIENACKLAANAASKIRIGYFPAPEDEKECTDRCEFRSLCREKRMLHEEEYNAAE